MLVAIDFNKRVLWLHEDDTLKELPQYAEDENILVVDKEVHFAKYPDDEYIYDQIWNEETQEIEAHKAGKKPVTDKQKLNTIYETTEAASVDTLTNMDLLLSMDETLTLILEELRTGK